MCSLALRNVAMLCRRCSYSPSDLRSSLAHLICARLANQRARRPGTASCTAQQQGNFRDGAALKAAWSPLMEVPLPFATVPHACEKKYWRGGGHPLPLFNIVRGKVCKLMCTRADLCAHRQGKARHDLLASARASVRVLNGEMSAPLTMHLPCAAGEARCAAATKSVWGFALTCPSSSDRRVKGAPQVTESSRPMC